MSNFSIDYGEVCRYLGFKGTSPNGQTEAAIRGCMDELLYVAEPRGVYKIYPRADGEAFVEVGGLRLTGEGIAKALVGSERVAVMGATLGIQVDRLIKSAQLTNMAKALYLDAAATAFIEAVCDRLEEEIAISTRGVNTEAAGLIPGMRFSPGYGDLPINIQPEICEAIGAYKAIGLTVNESCLLIPQKSVTAFLGLFKGEIKGGKSALKCAGCSMRESCGFNREGKNCVYG